MTPAKAPATNRDDAVKARQGAFLEAYAKVGNITESAALAGHDRAQVYRWSEADLHGFRERFHNAKERYADKLERLMHERLADPAGNRGSDVLLIFALKAVRREKYGDNGQPDDEAARELIRELRALQRRNREAKRKAIDVVPSADDVEKPADSA